MRYRREEIIFHRKIVNNKMGGCREQILGISTDYESYLQDMKRKMRSIVVYLKYQIV